MRHLNNLLAFIQATDLNITELARVDIKIIFANIPQILVNDEEVINQYLLKVIIHARTGIHEAAAPKKIETHTAYFSLQGFLDFLPTIKNSTEVYDQLVYHSEKAIPVMKKEQIKYQMNQNLN